MISLETHFRPALKIDELGPYNEFNSKKNTVYWVNNTNMPNCEINERVGSSTAR